MVVGQHIGEVEAAGRHEVNVLRQRSADVADVGGPAFGGADVADEVAEVAGDVDDPGVGLDVALQETAELAPDLLLARLVLVAEAMFVDLFEDDRSQLVGGAFAAWLRHCQSHDGDGHLR